MALQLIKAKRHVSTLARAALAVLVAATLVPITSLVSHTEAHAASGPPSTITATGTVTGIAGYDALGPNAFYMALGVDGGYEVASYGHNSPYFDDTIAMCINPGNPNPPNGVSSWGQFNWSWNDEAAGIAWYKGVFRFADVPNNVGMPYQNLGEIYLGIRWDFEGWVKISKASSIPSISNSNSDYSLAGAVYELRNSNDGSLADTLTTNAAGTATSKGVKPGSYYLVEKSAPRGFKIDTARHNVTVTGGSTSTATLKDEPLVCLALAKRSSIPDTTEDNECYSLADAIYGVYTSKTDAQADANRVCKLTTDGAGSATSPLLERGSYFVKEIEPPKGYAKDEATYPVDLDLVLTRLEVVDTPQGNPIDVAVKKLDADTSSNLPQGDAALAGAEFTLSYYDGYYDTAQDAESSGQPTRTWIVRTDENGIGHLQESSLVSGSDSLYHNSQNSVIIPLGTVLIHETKAPDAYVLPDPTPTSVIHITSNSSSETVTTYNAASLADTVKRGDIAITKAYDPTPDEDTGKMVPESGVVFDFYASHQFEGTTIADGANPAFTLTTKEDGRADTKGIYIIKNADGTYTQRVRTEADHGGIPHDTYLMVQREAQEGFEVLDPMLVSVNEDGKTYDCLLQNGAVQTPIKVVKLDSETGLVVPYPASWQIIDKSTGKPVSMTTHYPTVETFDVFTSDEQGRLILPEKLAWGEYELHEVQAPASGGIGYLQNPVNVSFSTEDGHDWDNPLTIEFADAPAKGKIEITKADSTTSEAIAGATYTIQAIGDIFTLDGTLRASDGEVVDTITTDEQGSASSKELYLGHYGVLEAISPDGFALDTTRYMVALDYEDQNVEVLTHTLEVADTPSTLRIEKVDALTKQAMANVEFSITSDTGDFERVVTTDEDGSVELGYLPHGSYSVIETTPAGFVSDTEPFSFIVDDQGLVDGKALLVIEVENTPIQVSFSKTDIATGEELPGCGMEIYEADTDGKPVGDALHSWISSDTPHIIVGSLEPGEYVFHETYPAPGYTTAQDVVFSVLNTKDIQAVSMQDDFTRIDVAKKNAETDELLAGATLSIYKLDENGKRSETALHTWTSGVEPVRFERLEPGEYLLVEHEAPLGFDVANEVSFTVAATSDVQLVEMYDKALPKTPEKPGDGFDKTGFDPTALAALVALLATGSLVGLGIGIKRHRMKKIKTHTEEEISTPLE